MKNQTAKLLGLVFVLCFHGVAMASDGFWGELGIKEWMTTLSPGGGMASTKANVPMAELIVGYEKLFGRISLSSQRNYSNPSYPFGTLDHNQSAFNLGYLITPD